MKQGGALFFFDTSVISILFVLLLVVLMKLLLRIDKIVRRRRERVLLVGLTPRTGRWAWLPLPLAVEKRLLARCHGVGGAGKEKHTAVSLCFVWCGFCWRLLTTALSKRLQFLPPKYFEKRFEEKLSIQLSIFTCYRYMYRYQFIFVRQLHAIEINVGNCKNKKIVQQIQLEVLFWTISWTQFLLVRLNLKLKKSEKAARRWLPRAIAEMYCV